MWFCPLLARKRLHWFWWNFFYACIRWIKPTWSCYTSFANKIAEDQTYLLVGFFFLLLTQLHRGTIILQFLQTQCLHVLFHTCNTCSCLYSLYVIYSMQNRGGRCDVFSPVWLFSPCSIRETVIGYLLGTAVYLSE